ncbi:MAG: threonylcarbamoyl-AMP synthase [Bacteroidetes bacterium]|nr:threonylcarbamoyl-AMP synthase [Bacteroidota bacterium]
MLDEIFNTTKVLTSGGTILYPTDTIWGIGCDATNADAVDKIYKIKKRVESKCLIVLVSDTDMLKDYLVTFPDIVKDLLNNLERPTTIIYPHAKNLVKNVIAPDGSVAIRIVKDEFCKQMITLFGKPIVSTSANVSGETAPISFCKISEEIIDSVDYVVKYDRNRIRQMKPSTIIKVLDSGEYEIVRP